MTHTYARSRRCDKTWSLSRTCPRRVCLSFFMYTFIKGKSAMVSLQRELFSFAPSPSCLAPAVSSASVCVTPSLRRASFSLFHPYRGLRKLRLPLLIAVRRCLERVRWRSYRPSTCPRCSQIGRATRRLSPSSATHPFRPLSALYIHQRRFRRELTRSGSSSSHRRFARCYRLSRDGLVQERWRGHCRPGDKTFHLNIFWLKFRSSQILYRALLFRTFLHISDKYAFMASNNVFTLNLYENEY